MNINTERAKEIPTALKKVQLRKVLCLVLLFFHLPFFLYSQAPVHFSTESDINSGSVPTKGNGQISGVVLDASNNEPVPYATIALILPGTEKPVDGTVADMNGKFSISKVSPGKYKLQISFMGYEPRTLENIEIIENNSHLELGGIKINPSTQLLKEVTVEGQKALFEEKVDRTIYNAENDDTNRGGDATDVLRKVPMLNVDMDGNVSLRGSQNILVLINNRPSAITANSVADALKQIPADMIKSVEVITSPSAKYDAEGTSGIINIITKKNTIDGYSLGIDAGAGYRGSNLGLNGSLKTGKMGFTLGGFGRYGYNITGRFENNQYTRDGENTIFNYQNAATRNRFLFGRYQFGWDYDINKHNFINASIQYGARNRNTYQDHLLTQTYRNAVLESMGLRDVWTNDLSGTIDVNLNYTRTFDKPQQEFSILTLFSRNDRTNNFINNILDEQSLFTLNRLKNLNESDNQEQTIQLDYQHPLGKNQLVEVGGKNIFRQVSSDFQLFMADGAEGDYVPVAGRNFGNVFNYNQNVTAGYVSYTLTTAKMYSLKVGTRYEYTTINANFQDNEKVHIPSYGSIVPSVNLSKKLANGNTLKAAYNRRLQRPSLQFLNPNLQAPNRLDATIGNPELEPEFTDNYELSYNTYIKGSSLSFTSFMRNSFNSIQSVRQVMGDTILTTFQNIGKEDAYGLSVFANISISNRFSLNGGTDVYYAVMNNNNPNPEFNFSNQGMIMTFRLFGNYKLNNGWGLQAFGFHRGRQVQLQGFQDGFRMYSLMIKKDFNNKKGSIGFGAENFLTSAMRIHTELSSPTLERQSLNEMHNMSFRVNLNYRIGKFKDDNSPRRRRKSVTNDDLKSGGDNGMQEGGGQGAPSDAGSGPRRPPQGVQPQGGGPAQPGGGERKYVPGENAGPRQGYRPEGEKSEEQKPDQEKQEETEENNEDNEREGVEQN